MAKILTNCSVCSKSLIEDSRFDLGTSFLITYKCGHSDVREKVSFDLASADDTEAEADKYPGIPDKLTGYQGVETKLYPYQRENVFHFGKSGYRQLLMDDTGMGKTISAIAQIVHYKLFPVLVVCKKKLKTQWLVELFRKAGLTSLILETKKSTPYPGFHVYIASYDSLEGSTLLDSEEGFCPKLIVLDECQAIKNGTAKRTLAVQQLTTRTYTRKRDPISAPTEKTKKLESKGIDLFRFHGIDKRFKLQFENLPNGILGLCESKVEKNSQGLVTGTITVDISGVEQNTEDEGLEIILHEIAHSLTPGAGHNKLWRDCYVSMGGNGETVANYGKCNGLVHEIKEFTERPYVLAMSATPIKNHAGEYFPILNIVKPERFSNKDAFLRNDVSYYQDGQYMKVGGLRNAKEFLRDNSDFLIRHKREEWLKDLPPVRRNFKFFPLAKDVEAAYKKLMKEFSDFYEENGKENMSPSDRGNILGYLNKMRKLTGLSKVDAVLELAENFLEETEDSGRLLTIFHHHEDVGNLLMNGFRERGIEPIRFWPSDPDLEKKVALCASNHWPSLDTTKRVLIASTLASGEGLNLHKCSDAILAEREWNPSNEDQAAPGRFLRIGTTADMIDITIPTAVGTIDEMLSVIVEKKREEVTKSLDGEAMKAAEQSIIRELTEILYKEGRARWAA